MKNIVEVRNIKFGEGIPKICVPLVGKTEEDVLREAENLKNLKLDVVEWRIDHYEGVTSIEKVVNLLSKLRKVIGELPVLVTFRSSKEGGELEVSTEYYAQLNKKVAESGLADLIDVELFTGDDIVKDIVESAHKNNTKVVMSNHDFHKTPNKDEIVNRLRKMQDLNADLPKIAVMPQSPSDVLTLLTATDEMVTKYAKTPIITMSMSGTGVISRLAGEVFGSALTFGAGEKASAPGQIAVSDLYSILNTLHESK